MLSVWRTTTEIEEGAAEIVKSGVEGPETGVTWTQAEGAEAQEVAARHAIAAGRAVAEADVEHGSPLRRRAR